VQLQHHFIGLRISDDVDICCEASSTPRNENGVRMPRWEGGGLFSIPDSLPTPIWLPIECMVPRFDNVRIAR